MANLLYKRRGRFDILYVLTIILMLILLTMCWEILGVLGVDFSVDVFITSDKQ